MAGVLLTAIRGRIGAERGAEEITAKGHQHRVVDLEPLALPLADVTIYYMDMRAFGKGYDDFYEQSKAMGVEYIKGKVARIEQLENGNMALHYEDMLNGGGAKIREHDLVSLTVGFLPNLESLKLFKGDKLEADD